jgi:CPA2 family monovalent cation:H+ antiporter-2
MHDTHAFLASLTVVLAVAAVTTVLFQRFRQPVVLGYILAGLIVGPHVPVPLIADRDIVHTLSELGVILLMFSLGLEFSLPRLIAVAPTAGVTALIQCVVMAWLGYVTGRLFGWTVLESVFTGVLIAISSTTIIAKVFDERRIGGRLRELVVGILLTEDLIAVVSMAILTTVAAGAGVSAATVLPTIGRLALFLLALLLTGMLVVPRFMRVVFELDRAETTLVASVGICFAVAWIAQAAGYSVALGAFLAGSLVAESGRAHDVEHLVQPVRDMFLAVFFVSVGLLIDPALVLAQWRAVVVLTGVVIVGKVVSVSLGAFLTGTGPRLAVQTGMSLAQIGEFSYIIAALGLTLGATREFLYPVAVAVSAVTTLTTPWLIRAAEPVASWVDRTLPPPLQTFVALYGTWVERMRAGPAAERSQAARAVRLMALDAAVLSALVVGAALGRDRAADAVARAVGIEPEAARVLVVAGAVLLSLPLLVGLWRVAQRLGATLAETALPRTATGVDFDAAPRRSLVTALQLAVTLVAGFAVLVVTQPFLPGYSGFVLLAVVLVIYGVAFVRSTVDLDSHVQAGSQAVVEALTNYARAGRPSAEPTPLAGLDLLPSLGKPVAILLGAESPAVGHTLAELDLRSRTGATVLAISRNGASIVTPPATERLCANDLLALTGTLEAIGAASELLLGTGPPGAT